MVKKNKTEKRNLYLTENQLSRNKMWCAEDNHTYMCHIIKQFLTKYQFFTKLPQISHIHKNHDF